MLHAVTARLGKQFDELTVAATEAAFRHLTGGMRALQERRVDQQRALVVGDHRRLFAALPQQLATTADGRGLAATQEPADQVDRHDYIVSTAARRAVRAERPGA